MTVVAPGASFTVTFISKDRAEVLDSCVIINKNTNVSTTLVLEDTITYFDKEYYVEADITLTVAEGDFLKYTIYDDQSNVSYVGSVFVTSQTDYSINDGEYTENETENEYITP